MLHSLISNDSVIHQIGDYWTSFIDPPYFSLGEKNKEGVNNYERSLFLMMVILFKYLRVKLKNKSPSKVITWDGLFHVRNMHCGKTA